MMVYLVFALCASLVVGWCDGKIARGTYLKGSKSSVLVENLEVNDYLVGYDKDGELVTTRVRSICKSVESCICRIVTSEGCIDVSRDHLLYDPIADKWMQAEEFGNGCFLLGVNKEIQECLSKEYLSVNSEMYDISVDYPHNFFASDNYVLIHNFFPLTLSVSVLWDIASGFDLETISLGVGSLGAYLFHWMGLDKQTSETIFSKKRIRYLDEEGEIRWRTPGEGDDWSKLPNGQGWRDAEGNIWKPDHKHKDNGINARPCPHWDVSDSKGKKVREVDEYGKELWPDGPKNKNKKP